MIIFPIIQIFSGLAFFVLFCATWVMGLISISNSFDKVPLKHLNPYSGAGLKEVNNRLTAPCELEKTPMGKRLDWCVKRLTFFAILGLLALGIEQLIIALTNAKRYSL